MRIRLLNGRITDHPRNTPVPSGAVVVTSLTQMDSHQMSGLEVAQRRLADATAAYLSDMNGRTLQHKCDAERALKAIQCDQMVSADQMNALSADYVKGARDHMIDRVSNAWK